MAVSWEFELKKDKWIRYEDELSASLNDHWRDEVFKTEYNGASLEFDFENMKQKNCDSGYSRNFRCVHVSIDGERYTWEYTNTRRRFVAFSPDQIRTLEDAYSSKKTDLTLGMIGLELDVDFDKMILSNSDADVVRHFRRTISKAETADTLPVPSRESSARVRSKRQALEQAHCVNPPTSKKTKSREAEKSRLMDGDGDEDDDIPMEPKTKARKVASKTVDDEEKRKKIVIKGSAPVDPECTEKVSSSHVYCEGNEIYDAMLNQTNIQNNNNKFFLIQLLEDDNQKRYSVWFRWGRVGFRGQTNLQSCGNDLEKAKTIFCSKFHDKTRNEWGSRHSFEKVIGKYDLIKMDYASADKANKEDKENDESSDSKCEPTEPEPSQLDKRIQDLLQLICDIRTMEEAVLEMEYDASRAPLGKITKEQLKAGYEALKRIEQFIGSSQFNRDFVDAVNDYYTRIPHAFGMRQPPLIKTKEALKKELDLLDVLSDIEVAVRTLNAGKDELTTKINPIDRHYSSMSCELKPLETSNPDYEMVERYLHNTHAATHSSYKMKLRNLFAVEKHGEEDKFMSSLGNRKLLWHGSRLANWYGILSQGLRIAPPEAPVTGYMFGKGVYFADMSSKSANYCFPQPGKPGFLLLADVALGETNNLVLSNCNANKLPSGKSSTWGLGKIGPNPDEDVTMEDGCVVPIGKPVDMTTADSFTLNYNEFIVYDVKQIRLKFLVEVDFDFESLL